MSPEALQRLKSLSDAGPAPVFMNGEEGHELVTAGFIAVDPSQTDASGQRFRVSITADGQAALASASAPKIVIGQVRSDISVPAPKRRGGANNLTPRQPTYPFDQLPEPTIGADGSPQCPSFHVAVTAENPEPWKSMASNVSAAKKRSEVEIKDPAGNPVMETVTKKTMLKGEDKKPLLDANGKRQYTESFVTQPKTEATKNFIARRVNKDDPDGEGVRVFRVPLDF